MSFISYYDFDRLLLKILENTKASEMINVPGFYELASEEFNNEVIRMYEEEQNEIWFINSYFCEGCNELWEDCWDSTSDDECPKCGQPISPYKSKEIQYNDK